MAALKTYYLVNQHTLSHAHMEIKHNNVPILWVNTQNKLLKAPVVNIHKDASDGPIIAACRLDSLTRDLHFYVGNPDRTDKDTWSTLQGQGHTGGRYEFQQSGQTYQWKRTHEAALGASSTGNKTYKLVDHSDTPLAIFVSTQSLFSKRHQVARIDFFVEMELDLELAGLATILGIQESIRVHHAGASGIDDGNRAEAAAAGV